MKTLYTEDSRCIAIASTDVIISMLKLHGVDVKSEENVDILENDLYSIIIDYIELHYGRGEYRHHH